jgi:Mitochondrial degradasome RNA helicase subunit C terminal/Suv3 C-terminal domain 1
LSPAPPGACREVETPRDFKAPVAPNNWHVQTIASRLSLKERFVYAQAPVDTRTVQQRQHFLDWAGQHAYSGQAGKPWFLDQVDGHSRLESMEQALRACTLWLWLDLRFPGAYGHVEAVLALRGQLNDGIERQLKGKRPLAQVRHRQRRGVREQRCSNDGSDDKARSAWRCSTLPIAPSQAPFRPSSATHPMIPTTNAALWPLRPACRPTTARSARARSPSSIAFVHRHPKHPTA